MDASSGKDLILSSCLMRIWAWPFIEFYIMGVHDLQAGRKNPMHLFTRIPMRGNYMFSNIAGPPPILLKETNLTPIESD